MTPKEDSVLERAKRGTLIDRCAWALFYIALLVGLVCSNLPIRVNSTFFPSGYWLVTMIIPFGLMVLAWAIFEWLKRRLL